MTPTPTSTPSGAAAQEPRTLRTSGSATVHVTPNAARLFFGVQTQAAAIQQARQDNNQRVRKVLASLAALHISDLKTKTTDVRVDILHGRADGVHAPSVTGFRITNTFTVLVQENDPVQLAALAGRVLDAALESGATSVQQIAFLNEDGTTAARRQALTLAVEDALANARALAAGARKDLGETIAIEGPPVYHLASNRMRQSANVVLPAGGEETTLVAGDLVVTCQVTLTCTF